MFWPGLSAFLSISWIWTEMQNWDWYVLPVLFLNSFFFFIALLKATWVLTLNTVFFPFLSHRHILWLKGKVCWPKKKKKTHPWNAAKASSCMCMYIDKEASRGRGLYKGPGTITSLEFKIISYGMLYLVASHRNSSHRLFLSTPISPKWVNMRQLAV